MWEICYWKIYRSTLCTMWYNQFQCFDWNEFQAVRNISITLYSILNIHTFWFFLQLHRRSVPIKSEVNATWLIPASSMKHNTYTCVLVRLNQIHSCSLSKVKICKSKCLQSSLQSGRYNNNVSDSMRVYWRLQTRWSRFWPA